MILSFSQHSFFMYGRHAAMLSYAADRRTHEADPWASIRSSAAFTRLSIPVLPIIRLRLEFTYWFTPDGHSVWFWKEWERSGEKVRTWHDVSICANRIGVISARVRRHRWTIDQHIRTWQTEQEMNVPALKDWQIKRKRNNKWPERYVQALLSVLHAKKKLHPPSSSSSSASWWCSFTCSHLECARLNIYPPSSHWHQSMHPRIQYTIKYIFKCN